MNSSMSSTVCSLLFATGEENLMKFQDRLINDKSRAVSVRYQFFDHSGLQTNVVYTL